MIEIDLNIPLPPKKAWEMLTEPRHMHNWWGPDIVFERQRKGRFIEKWKDEKGREKTTRGTVTALEDFHRLQMDWQDEGWPQNTRVEFLLYPVSGDGTALHLQHSGWGMFDDADRKKIFDDYYAEWSKLLKGFADYCEKQKG
jgi:uncharacterized protein YndB with AHSA1/START domain